MENKRSREKIKKNVILILGMHRSGTSALTGLLHQVGAVLGPDLLEASYDNTNGFFENKKITSFNNSILKKLDLTWDTPCYFISEVWKDKIDIINAREKLLSIINDEFGSNETIFIKDPRISILLPIWKELLNGIHNLESITIYRNPKAVFESLEKRNKLKPVKSAKLWLAHNFSILKHSSKRNIFVAYEDLVSDPRKVLKNIALYFPNVMQIENADITFIKSRKISSKVFKPRSKKGSEIFNKVEKLYSVFSRASNSKNLKAVKINSIVEEIQNSCNDFIAYSSLSSNHFSKFVSKTTDKTFYDECFDNKLGFNFLTLKINSNTTYEYLRFYPSNQFSVIRNLSIKDQKGIEIPLAGLSQNILIEHGKSFVCNENSFFALHNIKDKNITELTITLEYQHQGKETLSEINDIELERKKWIENKINEATEEARKLNIDLQSEKELTSNLHNSIQSLKDALHANKEIHNTSLNIILSLEEEISKNQEEKNQHADQIENLNNKIRQLEKTKVQMNNESVELINNIEELQLTTNKLKSELNSNDSGIKTMENLIAKLDSDNKNLEDKVIELKAQINNDKINQGKLKTEIDSIKDLLHETEIEKAKKVVTLEFLTKQLDEFKFQIKKTEDKLEIYRSERDQLKLELNKINEEKISQQYQIEKLQYQLELSMQKVGDLKYSLETEEEFYSKLITESNMIIAENEESQQKLLMAEHQNSELIKEQKFFGLKMNELSEGKIKIKSEYDKIQNEYNKLKSEYANTQIEYDRLKSEYKQTKEEKNQLTNHHLSTPNLKPPKA